MYLFSIAKVCVCYVQKGGFCAERIPCVTAGFAGNIIFVFILLNVVR